MKLKSFLFLAALAMSSGVSAQDLKILVNQKGKIGFADKDGNEVIKCQYESATPFSNGMAIVTKSGKSGMIDSSGKILQPIKYSTIKKWSNGLYVLNDGKKQGLCDARGNMVLKPLYSLISQPNCYGKALIAIGGVNRRF